jgi:hypothetical protein
VLPSEVPGVTLDSMRWYAHSGHEGNEFGTWVTVGAVGRIVSTMQASLVGVGVLVENMRVTTVVFRMVDSSFYEARPVPLFEQNAETVIGRESVRPSRPVPIGVSAQAHGRTPPEGWGCPTRARIIRLSPPGVALRPPRPPEDERPNSDLYAWNPRTFDVDLVLRQPWPGYVLRWR